MDSGTLIVVLHLQGAREIGRRVVPVFRTT
jgi:hypothetical protein